MSNVWTVDHALAMFEIGQFVKFNLQIFLFLVI